MHSQIFSIYVTAKNSQELASIADLQSGTSKILDLGIDNIAIQGNLLPTLTQVGWHCSWFGVQKGK